MDNIIGDADADADADTNDYVTSYGSCSCRDCLCLCIDISHCVTNLASMFSLYHCLVDGVIGALNR